MSSSIQMVEVDIPQSLFEEQGRQLYGARLLEIQVGTDKLSLSRGLVWLLISACTLELCYACTNSHCIALV